MEVHAARGYGDDLHFHRACFRCEDCTQLRQGGTHELWGTPSAGCTPPRDGRSARAGRHHELCSFESLTAPPSSAAVYLPDW